MYSDCIIGIAPQKPKVLLILCEEALVVFDISEVEKYNPQYNVPFVLDLHNPAVTSMEYVNECPDNLISSLHSCKSKKLVKEYSFKVILLNICVDFCINMYICMYVCMCVHVCMHACMHACMYVYMYVQCMHA